MIDIEAKLSSELGVEKWQVTAAVQLIDEDNTIPFIARYRKEKTGALNDEILRKLYERLVYLRNLEDKKQQVIATIRDQGKMTDALLKQIEEAQKYCKIEAFQPQYSLADRKDEKLIRWAYEQGLGIMTYGTLGGGILTGNYRKLRTFEQTDSRIRFYPYFKEPLFSKAMELLTIMDQIAEERNVSLAQIAEKWVIQKRFVSSCIIGAQSRARVEENCRNLQWELTDNEIRRLESVRIL